MRIVWSRLRSNIWNTRFFLCSIVEVFFLFIVQIIYRNVMSLSTFYFLNFTRNHIVDSDMLNQFSNEVSISRHFLKSVQSWEYFFVSLKVYGIFFWKNKTINSAYYISKFMTYIYCIVCKTTSFEAERCNFTYRFNCMEFYLLWKSKLVPSI